MENYPKISIVILNWNGLKDTINCLQSLKKITYPNYEVILVDNGSEGDDADVLGEKYKGYIRLITNKKNLGFAKGNNMAIRQVLKEKESDYVLLLNNDVIVNPTFLTDLVKVAESNMRLGSCQSKIFFLHNENIINNTGIIICKDGSAINRGINQKDIGYDQIQEIFGTCAACSLYRKKALEEIGLFDEDFFAYMEDVDLAWRFRLNGWKSFMVPNSIVYHMHSASNLSSETKFFLINRNTIFVLIKNFLFRYIFLFLINFISLRLSFLRAKKDRVKEFKKKLSFLGLIFTLVKSWGDSFHYLPKLLEKRYCIQKNKKVATKEILFWFDKFGPNS